MIEAPDIPDYVRQAKQSFDTAELRRLSRPRRPRATSAPPVISVIKNEADRLGDFLRHYRDGGVERFIFIDNGSDDGSIDLLAEQPDVELLQIIAPFHWPQKQGWINLAAAISGRSEKSWYIYADADEHIVFDGYGKLGFGDLALAMQRNGIRRVRGMLIDMYGEGPLLKSRYEPGQRLLEAYPYFDSDGYVEAKFKEIISRKGGPRKRAFGHVDAKFRPEMTKYPLFQLWGNETFANPHHIWPYEENFKSDCYLGILHFKFLPNVLARIEQAIADKSYWDDSLEYRCYDAVLRETPELSLMYSASRRYGGPEDLLKAGHITPHAAI